MNKKKEVRWGFYNGIAVGTEESGTYTVVLTKTEGKATARLYKNGVYSQALNLGNAPKDYFELEQYRQAADLILKIEKEPLKFVYQDEYTTVLQRDVQKACIYKTPYGNFSWFVYGEKELGTAELLEDAIEILEEIL